MNYFHTKVVVTLYWKTDGIIEKRIYNFSFNIERCFLQNNRRNGIIAESWYKRGNAYGNNKRVIWK